MNFLKTVTRLPAFTAAAFALLIPGATLAQSPLPSEGLWRGEFAINAEPVPFHFEIGRNGTGDGHVLTLINGDRRDGYALDERPDGSWGAVLGTFSSEIVLRPGATPEALTGSFRNLASNRRAFDLPFGAEHGRTDRFVPVAATGPVVDSAWRIKVVSKRPAPDQILELRREGDKVSGVLLTVVGDSRRLEGNIVGDELFLSTFTGPAPVYLRGRIGAAGDIVGTLSFGAFVTLNFEGRQEDGAALIDPFTLTRIVDGDTPLALSLPDADGHPVSLSDARFRDKVVVVQILGSWCPNSIDETRFLTAWRRNNPGRDVEVVSVAFEVESELDAARPGLRLLQAEHGIEHPLLFGGGQDKIAAGIHFPQIDSVAAYPTLLFLDRQGRVRNVHAGFSSPDTGEHYDAFVRSFDATVDRLLAESPSSASGARVQDR